MENNRNSNYSRHSRPQSPSAKTGGRLNYSNSYRQATPRMQNTKARHNSPTTQRSIDPKNVSNEQASYRQSSRQKLNVNNYSRARYSNGQSDIAAANRNIRKATSKKTIIILASACLVLLIAFGILVAINISKFQSYSDLQNQVTQTSQQVEQIKKENEELQQKYAPYKDTIDKYNAVKNSQ
ncbi:MAG: hypothetical protein MJ189_04775 [Coriobacteriales bacterium]|nr:hypothetical protein [Coriobacteriales bacterium]